MKLATVSQLKSHLGIPKHDTSKDEKLGLLLEGSSLFIQGETSRKFAVDTYDIKLSGNGFEELTLPQYPILTDDGTPAITTLTMDDVDILSEIESGTIDVDAETGILHREGGWRSGRRNIRIVFSAGYALPGDEESGDDRDAVPADLALAAIRLAARMYEKSTAEGVSNVSRASTSFNFKDGIDPDIKATISHHTKIRI